MNVKLFTHVLAKAYPLLVLTVAFAAWSNANLSIGVASIEKSPANAIDRQSASDRKLVQVCSVLSPKSQDVPLTYGHCSVP